MICLKPIPITDALLNFPTAGIAEWASGHYAVGDRVLHLGVAYEFVGGVPPIATTWVNGATYAMGDWVISPATFLVYVCKVSGVSTITPHLSSGMWERTSVGTPIYHPYDWAAVPVCSAIEPKPAATAWVSGPTYAVGDVVSVASVFKEFTRVIVGAGTTSPELDSVNWLEKGPYEREWVSGTTYAFWDQVILKSTHRKYTRIVAGAGTTAPNVDTANWVDAGPTNKWACFDTLRNTPTIVPSPLTIVITPQKRITAIALVGAKASSVTITITVGGVVKYTTTRNMLSRSTVTWSGYFFGSFGYKPALLLTGLPPYAGATITVTLTNNTADVELGALCIGTPVDVGRAQYEAVSSALNFSKINRDEFGNTQLIPSRSLPKTDQITIADKGLVDSLYDLRIDINAVPCIWSTLDDKSDDGWFKAFLILGVYREFSINAKHPTLAQITLQIEEV